jgi:hypothetical protein
MVLEISAESPTFSSSIDFPFTAMANSFQMQ